MAKTVERIVEMKPYVDRAVQDEELRKNVQAAFGAARNVYDELLGNRGVVGIANRAATNEKIHEDVRLALDELKSAGTRLQQAKEPDHGTRNAVLLLTGIIVGALYNPWTGPATRNWLKEKVLGPSDEFTYSGNSGSGSNPPPDAA